MRRITCIDLFNLLDQDPLQVVGRQITELAEIKPGVIETRPYAVVCPGCRTLQGGKLPEGLEATVRHLHHEPHIGFKRLLQICEERCGLTLSPGGAVSIVERVGKAAQQEAEAIAERVRQSKVIGRDETSARLPGENWWQWVFVGENGEYHLIEPRRG